MIYKTLFQSAETEYTINKSRFIGAAAPVSSSEEALAFLEKYRAAYRDATHHCYAYVIGKNSGIMRYSDDGEPGGTAGLPIMEVIKARGVVDCCVVVTRYFGGILLGAGGLVRAYTHSCAQALNSAGVCEMHPTEKWIFDVTYPLWDKVRYHLESLPVKLEDTQYASSVSFELLMKSSDREFVSSELTRVTDGRIESLLEEEKYAPWIEST